MLDFSWSHILIVLIVALVVVGPKDLPRLMRIVGQWMGKARAMANEFRRSFDEMARQSELDELRKEIENLRTDRTSQSAHQSIVPDAMKSVAPAPAVEVEHAPEPREGEFKIDDEPVTAGYVPPSP